MSTVRLHEGDCLDVLRTFPDNSIDAVVTDPPYGLSNTAPDKVAETLAAWVTGDREHVPAGRGFMGAEWDAFVPPPAVWDEVHRVLKPGGHALVFAGARTQDLMGVSLRLAGFDLRDSVAWLYGSGFPKSLDVSKAIDKAARGYPQGAADPTSPNHGKYRTSKTEGKRWSGDSGQSYGAGGSAFLRSSQTDTVSGKTTANDTSTTAETSVVAVESDPENTPAVIATDEAKKWEGWGTALKPGHEPIILARKPFPGTVAANVQEHGTGALNIDAGRIGMSDADRKAARVPMVNADGGMWNKLGSGREGRNGEVFEPHAGGRWPTNVMLDEAAAAELDQQSGPVGSNSGTPTKSDGTRNSGGMYSPGTAGTSQSWEKRGGGASRFFYVAKAGKKERPEVDGVKHPTVKPLALIEHLVKLITPLDGTVLDLFGGSGTTAEAAIRVGRDCIIIEAHAPYIPLIQQRVDRATTTKAGTE